MAFCFIHHKSSLFLQNSNSAINVSRKFDDRFIVEWLQRSDIQVHILPEPGRLSSIHISGDKYISMLTSVLHSLSTYHSLSATTKAKQKLNDT